MVRLAGEMISFFLRLNELVRGWCRCCGKRCCFLSSLMNRNSFNRVFFFNCFFLLKFYFTIAPARSRVLLRSFFFCDRQWISSFFFFSRRQGRKLLFFLATASIRSPTLLLFYFVFFVSFWLGSSPLVSSGFGDDRSNGRQLFFFVYFYFILFFLGLTLFVVSTFAPSIHRRQKTKK